MGLTFTHTHTNTHIVKRERNVGHGRHFKVQTTSPVIGTCVC